MLYKKELKKVPLCEPAKSTKKELKDKAFIAGAKVVDVARCGKTLIVDYYSIKNNNLQVRFFSDGKSYIVYDVQKDKWTKSYVNVVLYPLDKYSYDHSVHCSHAEEIIATSFFKVESTSCWIYFATGYAGYREFKGILAVVDSFIKKQKSEKREKKEDRALCTFKARQSWFPKPDKNMDDFCNNKVFSSTYIFFSVLNKKRERTCACSRCGNTWQTSDTPKHKGETVCPKCSSSAVWFAECYQGSISERSTIVQCYKHDGQLIVRQQIVIRTFYKNKPALTYYDDAYTFYLHAKGKQRVSSYFWLKNNGFARWSDERLHQECTKKAYIYTGNLNEVFGDKYYNVNLKQALELQCRPIRLDSLLSRIKTNPEAEYLCKLGLTELASELDANDYYDGDSFGSILGINPQYLSMYQNLHITRSEHDLLRNTDRYVSPDEICLFRELKVDEWANSKVLTCLRHQRLETLCSYLKKFSNSKEFPNHGVGILADYYEMSEALDIPINKYNVRPKNLRKAHDVLVERYNKVKAEIKDKKSKAVLALVNHWFKGYEKDGYCIKVPKYRSDFIREGQALSHCVGTDSYYNNHKAGERMIFFIRKAAEPEIPYVTAEIDMVDFRLIQCYGAHDKPPIPEVRAFVTEFCLWLKRHSKSIAERKAG